MLDAGKEPTRNAFDEILLGHGRHGEVLGKLLYRLYVQLDSRVAGLDHHRLVVLASQLDAGEQHALQHVDEGGAGNAAAKLASEWRTDGDLLVKRHDVTASET